MSGTQEIAEALAWASSRVPTSTEAEIIREDGLDRPITLKASELYLLLRQSESAPWQSPDSAALSVRGDADRAAHYLFHPIPDEDAQFYESFLKQIARFWHAHEIRNVTGDFSGWSKIPQKYRDIFVMITGFFVVGDALVTRQVTRFLRDSPSNAATAALSAQLFFEAIHMDTYGLFAALIPDSEARAAAFTQVDKLPCVKAKAAFIEEWMDKPNAPSWVRYLAAAAAEGIFFASLFSLVFYFRRTPYFPAFVAANSFIIEDEALHRRLNIILARRVAAKSGHPIKVDVAHAILKAAVQVETGHIAHIISTCSPIESEEADDLNGITTPKLIGYIQTLANQIAYELGIPAVYSGVSAPPPPCMAGIGVTEKHNVHEVTVTTYQNMSVSATLAKVASMVGAKASEQKEVEF